MKACQAGDAQIVKMLIGAGASLVTKAEVKNLIVKYIVY